MEKPAGFPPGPPRIPLAGSVPFLRGIGVEKIVNSDVASYGPVTGLFAGMYPMIMVNDWKLAKSLFAMEEFSGRLWYDMINLRFRIQIIKLFLVITPPTLQDLLVERTLV